MSRQGKYSITTLERAVQAVSSKSMGYLKASKVYNVPRSTIYDKVQNNSAIGSRQGPNTVLSSDEEERLAKWVVEMSKIGYGRSKQELLETVKLIIKVDRRKNPFKDGKPGKDWYYAFLKRHPELSIRSLRQLSKERAVIKPASIHEWFADFEAYVTEETGDALILQDPPRMYNADESGFSLCPKTGHVLGLRGAKSVYNLTASDRSQITVLPGMSATAHYLRPMLVFPGQRFSKNMLDGFDEAVMGRSENGWMDSELFVQRLKTVFIHDIEERHVKRPVILLVDGHKTHMMLEASDICRENGIVLYCLLEHASHLLQPCDLQLFGALKESWKTSLRQWQIQHVGQYVTKYEFASIFKTAWENATKVEVAVKGFQDAGLFPLNANAVLKTDKLQTSKLFMSPPNTKGKEGDGNAAHGDDENGPDATMTDKEMGEIVHPENGHPEVEHDVDPTERVDRGDTSVGDAQIENETDAQSVPPATDTPSTSREAAPDSKVLSTHNKLGHVEYPLSKVLKIPEPKRSSTSRSVKRVILPKAITGQEFRAILLEKKRKREEEENAKEQRKLDRIRKHDEKEKQKNVKAEERLVKMKERKEKKAEQLKMKELKKKIKLAKQKKRRDSDDDSTSSDTFSVHDESDDEIQLEANMSRCFKCDGTEDESGWIRCQICFRFFHRKCTDIPFETLTEEEVIGFPFECLYC